MAHFDGRQERLLANREAEQDTLTCILNNRFAMAKVADWLLASHFFSTDHTRIYQAMLSLYREERRCSVTNVAEELDRLDLLEQCGGRDYLGKLENGFGIIDGVEEAATRVVKKAGFRQLLYAAQEITNDAVNEADDAVEHAIDLVMAVALGSQKKPLRPFSEIVDTCVAALIERSQMVQEGGVPYGLSTGFLSVDRLLGRLLPAKMYTLGALTGVGKSVFAWNMAIHIALEARHVLMFSLEMSEDELIQRALGAFANIDQSSLRDGALGTYEQAAVKVAARKLRECDMKLDTRTFTMTEIITRAKSIHGKKSLDLIVVDYLQLVEPTETKNRSVTRTQEIADNSRRLKRLAQELEVPVLVVVQLNRELERRAGGTPNLADINESGAIARDSDGVFFIHIPPEEQEKSQRSQAHEVVLTVAKGRNSRKGEVRLRFSPRLAKHVPIYDPTDGQEEEEATRGEEERGAEGW